MMKNKVLYWIPRILGILAILFMMMFSFDVFGGNEPLSRQLLGFLMHNIPAMILLVILIVAWRYENIGGILFVLVAVYGCIRFRAFAGNPGSLLVMAPFFLTGILFLVHYYLAQASARKS